MTEVFEKVPDTPRSGHVIELAKLVSKYAAIYEEMDSALDSIRRNQRQIVELEKRAAELEEKLKPIRDSIHTALAVGK